jgi:hypothetical protein
MTGWIIVALLVFIAAMLCVCGLALERIAREIVALSGRIDSFISRLEHERDKAELQAKHFN